MIFLGRDIDRVARVNQAGRALQRHFRRMNAHDLTANAAQILPLRARTQAAAVKDKIGLIWLTGLKVADLARAFPVQGHTQALQLVHQCCQQLAVVQLAFAGQVYALVKAALHGGLASLQLCANLFFHGGQAGVDAAVFFEQAKKARGIGLILAVPKDQRAVLLQKHMLAQLTNQLGPAL